MVFMGSCIQANFYALVSEAMRRMTAGHAWAERWRNGLRNGPMLPECTRFDPLKACLAPSDRLAIWSAQAHHPDRPRSCIDLAAYRQGRYPAWRRVRYPPVCYPGSRQAEPQRTLHEWVFRT